METTTTNQSEYGIKVSMLIADPKHSGTISQEEANALDADLFSYTYGDKSMDSKVTFNWAIDPDDDTILLAKYIYEGAPAGVAAHDMLALMFKDKTLEGAITITYQALERFLRNNPNEPALPEDEVHAITFAVDAAKCAIKAYNEAPLNKEEETHPCKDTPMSLASIKETIAAQNIQTLEALAQFTKAGSSDEACREELLALIEENNKVVAEKDALDAATPVIPFADLTLDHRIIAIETAIDNTVRPFLVADGGDIDILNVKENGATYEVYISYLGACSSCDSSGSGTLIAIENALKDKLDPNIRVIPI